MRSTISDEASKWLIELLRHSGDDVKGVSSHSLKATVLSWMAKAGSDPHHRTILGHHPTQKGSLEVYSRDMLSAPLRTLEDVLRQIRMGALHPDLTRSGHVQEPTMPDCKDAIQEPLMQESEVAEQNDSSSSDSSTTSSSEGSTDSASEDDSAQHWSRLGSDDPNATASAWGYYAMFQHTQSKIVHIEADSELQIFKCGMKATAEHRHIRASAFLEYRKCKRCPKASAD